MTKNEFERLKPGQIIKHKKNNEWTFIVHQNYGVRVTAVRTVEIHDPNDWEVLTEIKPTDKLRNYEDVFDGDPLGVHSCGYPRGKHQVDANNNLICPKAEIKIVELTKAADSLHKELKDFDWYQSIGIGNNELFVYTSNKKFPKMYARFSGFPVHYNYVGKVKPCSL